MDVAARRRFARHLLLAEVGERGQARLCAHAVRVTGDTRATEVAAMYLDRAGVRMAHVLLPPLAGGGALAARSVPQPPVLDVGSASFIAALAGRSELEHAAAFLAGAFAAVEEIKRALDVGRAGDLEGVAMSGPAEEP